MKKALGVVAVLGVCCVASSLRAQTSAAACPSTKTLDELVHAVDDAVSGPGDKDRACMRQLFTADAQLTPLAKGPDGSLAPKALMVEGWIERVKQRGSKAFYERQVKYSSDVFGSIAHLWSTYEIRETPDGAAEARGINSIQAVKQNGEWKVAGILWEAESPAEQVPEQYLPKK
jgi:hypothetical protein